MGLHSTYGFLLDENLAGLRPLFPKNRAKTVHDYRLNGQPDARVIERASMVGLIVVTRDVEYVKLFTDAAHTYNAEQHLYGLVIIGPKTFEEQKRLFPLGAIEKRMRLNGNHLKWTDVHDSNLLVRVQSGRNVKVERLPPCPCQR